MAKKIFKYRGLTIEELQALSMDELLPLLSSAARRKIARGYTEAEQIFLKRIENKKDVKTHCREVFVLPFMVGKTIRVHRGNTFEELMIRPEMIGHRLGEFSFSRKRVKHSSMGVGSK